MPTIHTDSRGHALAVQGDLITDAGPLEQLTRMHPHARVRTWPGILTPGLVNLHGNELLEQTYHPDPREADALGTAPLTGEALAALAMDDTRWGASARRGIQRMLAHGTVAVACAPLHHQAVRHALTRTGLRTIPRETRPPGPPSLDPYSTARPPTLPPPRTPGTQADFAIFDVATEADLAARGAATCVATVIAGRLLYRHR